MDWQRCQLSKDFYTDLIVSLERTSRQRGQMSSTTVHSLVYTALSALRLSKFDEARTVLATWSRVIGRSLEVTLRTTTLLICLLPITPEGSDNTFTIVEWAFIRSKVQSVFAGQSTCCPGARFTRTQTLQFQGGLVPVRVCQTIIPRTNSGRISLYVSCCCESRWYIINVLQY